MAHRPALAALASLAGLAGCTAPAASDPFEASGELIAFSGGAAGASGACITCHGTAGGGDGNLAPQLAGLGSGYIARQIEHFASGARRHPQMEWIAGRLSHEARERVAGYYASLTPASPERDRQAQDAVDCEAAQIYHTGIPERGIPSCASCHGAGGAGDAGNPPLYIQPSPYLAHQLDAWASGERYGDPDGAMTRISRALSFRDRQAVAGYAARLQGDRGGRELPAACLRTHRPDRPGGA